MNTRFSIIVKCPELLYCTSESVSVITQNYFKTIILSTDDILLSDRISHNRSYNIFIDALVSIKIIYYLSTRHCIIIIQVVKKKKKMKTHLRRARGLL
jgi:hypothetical protein